MRRQDRKTTPATWTCACCPPAGGCASTRTSAKVRAAAQLDGGGIEAAAASVATDVASNAPDLLIVNKFGKIEAAGRGFRPLIGDALDWGIPVIVGVNDLDRADLEAFTGGMGAIVATETARIVSWAETARRRSAA